MPSPCIVRNASTDGFDERYKQAKNESSPII